MMHSTIEQITVSDVFTPRRPQVNPVMYISRPALELAMAKAIAGSKHVSVHGQSGMGKSWLYKHVLDRIGAAYHVVDLSIAALWGLDGAFRNAHPVGRRSVADTPEAERGLDEFDRLCARARAPGHRASLIVFENVEQAAGDAALLKHLASYILRLDSAQFAGRPIRLMFIGTRDITELAARQLSDAETVRNRVTVLPEIGRLSLEDIADFTTKGVFGQLRLRCEMPADELARRINLVAQGNAQRVHEICYDLCFDAVQLCRGHLTRAAIAALEAPMARAS